MKCISTLFMSTYGNKKPYKKKLASNPNPISTSRRSVGWQFEKN